MKTLSENQTTSGRLAYSRDEAAEILGASPATVDRLTKRGLLRPSRATRRPMYPRWELERFLRETSGDIDAGEHAGQRVSRPGRRKIASPKSSLSPTGKGGELPQQPVASSGVEPERREV